jgi:hypothetical protein
LLVIDVDLAVHLVVVADPGIGHSSFLGWYGKYLEVADLQFVF